MACSSVTFNFIIFIIIIIIIIIDNQPLGQFRQRPELSHATVIVMVRCIFGKILGIGYHYFPPLFRRSHFRHQVPPRPFNFTFMNYPMDSRGRVDKELTKSITYFVK